MRSFNVIFSILFIYIVAALTFWWISLMNQSELIAKTDVELLQARRLLNKNELLFDQDLQVIKNRQASRRNQYLGEGLTFLLVTMAGALVVYRSFKKTIQLSQQQNNFMLAVTHELKSPVAGIKLGLQTLKKHQLNEAQKTNILNSGVQEADRLTELCNNILITSQIEGHQYRMVREPINLSEELTQWCSIYENHLHGRLVVDINPHLYIIGDKELLHLAFNNLLQNAIKYAEKGRISVRLFKQDQSINLAVADEGAGVPEIEKRKLFQKFYRVGSEATRKKKGTGLGLYLVKQIAKQHKGKVSMADNYPHGTIFQIQLRQHQMSDNV